MSLFGIGEIESVRDVSQIGAFGLLILIAVWSARYAFPAFMSIFENWRKQGADELRQSRQDFVKALSEISDKISKNEEECRSERREMMNAFTKERELDRVARHEQGSMFQESLAQVFHSGK